MAEKLIFAEQTLEGFTDCVFQTYPGVFELSAGETYRVVWDGESFECTATILEIEGQTAVFIGDGSIMGLEGNGEPFVIESAYDGGITLVNVFIDILETGATSHTVAIYHVIKEDPSYAIKKSSLTAIGDAIRKKTGKEDEIPLLNMPDEIASIISDGVDEYYQRLAEAVLKRDAAYLDGDAAVLSMKGFKTSDGLTLGSLAPYSFAGFTKVEVMAFSDITWALANAFAGNTKLKIIDITVAESFTKSALMENSLNGCTALEAVIFRPSVNGLDGGWVHNNNGANDTFYIYVPSAYYSTVIANKSDIYLPESRYRRLEDYPDIDNWNSAE